MGKKGKLPKEKGKKDKKGSASLSTKKPQIDPGLLKDLDLKDVFRFWNSDVYVGQFNLTPQGDIFRQGRGKYFTADGCSFNGRWENDVLVEAEKLSFPEGSSYQGGFEAGKYNGPGVYGHPELGILDSSFVEGLPEGFVTLTDIDDKKWQGIASTGSLTVLPRNHLFDSEEALLIQRREEREATKKSVLSKSSKNKSLTISKSSKLSRISENKEIETSQDEEKERTKIITT